MGSKKHPDPWFIEYFQRHPDDDATRACPGRAFLLACPIRVRLTFRATLVAVATAPPPSFSGGGLWEAMHDDMAGWYEARVDHDGTHHRLFCRLERLGASIGLAGPSIVIVDGRSKPFRTAIPEKEYRAVRKLGDEYASRTPRSIALPEAD